MTPQERELVAELFDRLAALENAPRDADAERAIADGLARAPHGTYALVQTAIVQDEALKRANARIAELEGQLEGQSAEPPRQGGFLDNMRAALLGRDERRGSVPSVPPRAGASSAPGWAGGAPGAAAYAQPAMAQPIGTGGSFLGTAAASAAGVIGGAMLLSGIRSMFGHSAYGAGAYEPGLAPGLMDSPWGNATDSAFTRQGGGDPMGGELGGDPSGGRDDDPSLFAGGDQNDDAAYDDGGNDSDFADDLGGGDSDLA